MTKPSEPTTPPAKPPPDDDDAPVPRIPRTAGFKISMAALVRIALTGAMLTMIIVARRPCADSVSEFVTNFDQTGSGAQMPKPGTVDEPSTTGSAGDYESIRSDMTEEEVKAAIERAKAKARDASGSAGSASGSAGSAASGGGSAGSSGSSGSGSAGSGSAASGTGSAAIAPPPTGGSASR